jgi:hypothetical protein
MSRQAILKAVYEANNAIINQLQALNSVFISAQGADIDMIAVAGFSRQLSDACSRAQHYAHEIHTEARMQAALRPVEVV